MTLVVGAHDPSARRIASALEAWGALRATRPLPASRRGSALLAAGSRPPYDAAEDSRFVAKATTRDPAAVAWANAVKQRARSSGLLAPPYLPAADGRLVVDGVTLQPYLAGRAATPVELRAAEPRLRAFHAATAGMRQRPGFAGSVALLHRRRGGDVDLDTMPVELVRLCRAAWRALRDLPRSGIHGDLNADNVLVTPAGEIALVDWDECRVDAPLFDVDAWRDAAGPGSGSTLDVLADRSDAPARLGAAAAKRARLAFEVASCWTVEPAHARRLARALGWPER